MRDGPRHQSGACPESQGGEITCIRGRTEPPFCRRSACSWAALCSAHSLLHRPSRLRACQIPVSPTPPRPCRMRSEEHTFELQSLMRISYAVFCLKKKKKHNHKYNNKHNLNIHMSAN